MSERNNHIEKRLVLGLRRSESRAFDEIYHLYSRRIYRFAHSFLKNKPDAEEIVQEVFLRIWKNRKKIVEYYSLKAFLFTISYNIIIDKFRERVKENKYREFLMENAITSDSDIDKKIDYSDLNEMYTKAIDDLPQRRKMIYKMHRFEGLTYNEIAKKLEISVKTVENQMTNALKYIRKKLGPETLFTLLFFYLLV